MGRRARDDLHVGTRHLVDGRVRRPRLLRRGPRGHLRHPAHRAVDRAANAHIAGGCWFRIHAFARRHEAPRPASRHGRGVLRVRARRVRLRRPLPDPGFRAVRPRPRYEPLDDARVQVPRQAIRSRKGAQQSRPRATGGRMGEISRRRRRRRPLSHAPRHRSSGCGLLHARIRPRRPKRTRPTWTASCANWRRRGKRCRRR